MIAADGLSSTKIKVLVFEDGLIQKITGGDVITLTTTAGSLGTVTDNGDGTYTAELTSSMIEETAVISGTLNGNSIVLTASVSFGVARLSTFTTTLPLNEQFDPAVTSYTASVANAVDSFKVNPGTVSGERVKLTRIIDGWGYTLTANNESAGITIYNEGPNDFTFTVEGAFQRPTVYTVTIDRQRSAKLTDMKTTVPNFAFDPNKVNYSAVLFNNTTTLTPTFEVGTTVKVSINGSALSPIHSGDPVTVPISGGGKEEIVLFHVTESGKAERQYSYRIIGK